MGVSRDFMTCTEICDNNIITSAVNYYLRSNLTAEAPG